MAEQQQVIRGRFVVRVIDVTLEERCALVGAISLRVVMPSPRRRTC